MKSEDQILLEVVYKLITEGNKETRQFLEKNKADQKVINLFTKTDKENKPIFPTDHAIRLFRWIERSPIDLAELEKNYIDYKTLLPNKSLSDFENYEDFVKQIKIKKEKKRFQERNISKETTPSKNIDKQDIIADNDDVLILRADSERKCVEYGKGYSFCISRPHGGNQYSGYRLEKGSTFYFIFFKKIPKTDPTHVMVLDRNQYRWEWTFADNDTQQTTLEAILNKFPLLNEYKDKFINIPLTSEEKKAADISKDFKQNPTKEKFDMLTYEQQAIVLKYGMKIPLSIFDTLDKTLRNEYISVGPSIERDIYDKLVPTERERFLKVRKTVIDRYGLHNYSTKLDRELAISDKNLSAKYVEPDRLKTEKFYKEIRTKIINGIYNGTISYESEFIDFDLPELLQCGEIYVKSNLININLPNLKKCAALSVSPEQLFLPKLQECSDNIVCYDTKQLDLPMLTKCNVINALNAKLIKVPQLISCKVIQADKLKQIVIPSQIRNIIKSKSVFKTVANDEDLALESFKAFFKTKILRQ